ncbi:MAG: hypothetical protein ACPLRW_06660 [Moorellales bacterium]
MPLEILRREELIVHALHCILVPVGAGDAGAMRVEARCRAMTATEEYYGQVFDWRTEDDAGRWQDEDLPEDGVVLGGENPDLFRELLLEFKERPLRAALDALRSVLCWDYGWRPKEEVEADPELVEMIPLFEAPQEGMCYSARRTAPSAAVDEELLKRIWERADQGSNILLFAYQLQKAIRLASGEYLFDAQFYSVPDGEAKISTKTLKDALKHPERYALVFSDYHW